MSTATVAVPQTIEELGVRRSLLEELALKTVYLHGEMSLLELADAMHVCFAIGEELFRRLRKEELCEVKGFAGRVYQISITSQGRTRALELLSANQYAGPAPVSLEDYVSRARSQSVRGIEIRPEGVQRALQHLVLNKEILSQLGTALTSGKTIFLYGPTGSGKTSIAEAIPEVYRDSVFLPYALEVDGQIITVYDSHVHQRIEEQALEDSDARWVRCRRPRVVVGGELTLDMLDLQFNSISKFYSAPLQMKANNGILIIDDFGRQRMRPEELLNRWIVPLDRGIDFLTLAGGKKFEIPFDLFVTFATNLDPATLADEAFLRRIQSKVKIDNVTSEQFHEIFRRVCEAYKLGYNAAVVDELMAVLDELHQPLRPCFPRDILQQICWAARYEGKQARLDPTTVAQACRNYFLSV